MVFGVFGLPFLAFAAEVEKTATELEQGVSEYQKGNWPEAIKQFSLAIQKDPTSPAGYFFRAASYRYHGSLEEAKKDFQQVVQLAKSPAQAQAYYARAFASFHLQHFNQALSDLNDALAIDPQHAESLILRGRTLEKLNSAELAAASYSDAIKLYPKLGEAYLLRGNLAMRSGEVKKGLTDLRQAVRCGGIVEGELVYQHPKNGTEFHFVFVSPGYRYLGYDEVQREAQARDSFQLLFGHNASPMREVVLGEGFFVLDQELTAAQFTAFQERSTAGGDSGDALILTPAEDVSQPADDSNELPQAEVTWVEAMQFCETLQKELGMATRLPTEIEWECAARLQRGWLYPWGENPGDPFQANARQPESAPRALSRENDKDVTPNQIYDLAGNLSEWCLDEYQNDLFEGKSSPVKYMPVPWKSRQTRWPSDSHSLVEDIASADVRRSYRGGSFQDNQFNCQTPVRRSALASDASPAIGFRPVILLRVAK